MNDFGYKALAAALLAALSAYFRQLVGPLAVLLAVMALDYISGISAAWTLRRLDSRIGIRGILKKVGYLLVVAVGMALDYLIRLLGGGIGLPMEDNFFVGLVVILWLIINECISILENTAEMGAPVPPFVGKLLRRLKRTTENAPGPEEDPDGDD